MRRRASPAPGAGAVGVTAAAWKARGVEDGGARRLVQSQLGHTLARP
ncbi:MAG: hypothetical protein M0014_14360 [Actinomycetota bacterium]|nr:hypothetical protein [Actinomycetota bacterium]